MPNTGKGFHWFGRCERCSKPRILYVSHIEPKGTFPHLRWSEGNAFAFCYHCHMQWWHKHPREAEAWTAEKLGIQAREHLAFLARAGRGMRATYDPQGTELRLTLRLHDLAPNGVPGMVY